MQVCKCASLKAGKYAITGSDYGSYQVANYSCVYSLHHTNILASRILIIYRITCTLAKGKFQSSSRFFAS